MPSAATYREYPPAPDLAGHVACYWTARNESAPDVADVPSTDRVLPDACIDVIFDLTRGEGVLVGTMTRPLDVPRASVTDLLGIRFRPAGIGAVLPLPADEITDVALDVTLVWGPRIRSLAERLASSPDTPARLASLDDELRRRLTTGPGGDPLVRTAAGWMERARGAVRVDALARAVGLGARQLERRFRAAVGVSPKTACRVIRFQAAVGRMHETPAMPLSRVALETGYHDQAHFTRDFRRFAGEPPGAYRRRRGLDDGSVQDRLSGGG